MKRALQLVMLVVMTLHVFAAPVASAEEVSSAALHTEQSEAKEPVSESEQSSVDIEPKVAVSNPAPEVSAPTEQLKLAIEVTEVVVRKEDPPVVLPPLLINRVVAGISEQTSYEYIELHNPNPHDVFLDSWQVVQLRKDGDTAKKITLHGTVKAGGYVLIAGEDSALSSLSPDFRLASNSLITTGGIIQLIDGTGAIIEHVRWGDTADPSHSLATGGMLERKYEQSVPLLTGDTLKDFDNKTTALMTPQAGGYVPYEQPINRCDGVFISEIAANVATEKQFVELHNATSLPVTLDKCLLQTNRSTTKTFELSGVLNPGEYRAYFIVSSGLTLTKTMAGTVYLLSSDGNEEVDVRTYDSLALETSWSHFGLDDWRQTFTPTPNQPNAWQEFLPCEPGYERHGETGRCRKLAVQEAVSVVDCGPGKYRNSETNRCRSIEVAGALLPCKPGQVRSIETNRCRAVASSASTVVPCKENQERNPETNRCRNIAGTTIPEAAFAVQPIADTAEAFVGWWALGGVALLAAGYGIWEWRQEMRGVIRKVGIFFAGRK